MPRSSDKFAAVIADDVDNVRVEGVSFKSESGTAVIVRNGKNVRVSGDSAIGATGGLIIQNTRDSEFRFSKIMAVGPQGEEMTAGQIRDRISREIKDAKLSHSNKESILAALNDLFEDRGQASLRERTERFLTNFANVSTVLGFTWSVVVALSRAI